MLASYITPHLNAKAFNCTHCGVYARQDWGFVYRNRLDISNGRLVISQDSKMQDFRATACEHCGGCTIWHNNNIIFPFSGAAIQPNEDMPEDVKKLFLEARNILFASPKSAAALLRLSLARLCFYLGERSEHTDNNINSLIAKGLPSKLAEILRGIKTYGEKAIKPGMIEETDDVETAYKLLAFINIICDYQITRPKLIDLYSGDNLSSVLLP